MNKKFEQTRTYGVLTYADNLLEVTQAMIDDCRFEHHGEGGRIGGEEEQDLLNIIDDIVELRKKVKKFIKKY